MDNMRGVHLLIAYKLEFRVPVHPWMQNGHIREGVHLEEIDQPLPRSSFPAKTS